jgi:two-component system nitrate/nitrite response regulator NarL
MTTRQPPIRILIVDDHTLFRRGMTALLARNARFKVVGDAADAGEALRKAADLKPDVILLDNHLPGVNGVDALPALHDAAPGTRILMLTVSEDEDDLAAALRGGAAGHLLKTTEGEALTAAIERTLAGESVIAPEMTSKLVSAFRGAASGSPAAASHAEGTQAKAAGTPEQQAIHHAIASLSPREMDVLRGLVRGASNKEIAREHGIAETTVKIHVQHILRKLGVASRVHAAVLASESGLV